MTIQEHLDQDIDFTPAVVGFIRNDGKVLLGLRKKVSFGLGANLISGIGGKIGDQPEFANEAAYEALGREFAEEIKVEVLKFRPMGRLRFIFPAKPKWNQEVYIYVVDEWVGEPQETESIQPNWYPENELPAYQMWPDNPIWIPKVLAGEFVDAVFLYNDDNATLADQIIISQSQ